MRAVRGVGKERSHVLEDNDFHFQFLDDVLILENICQRSRWRGEVERVQRPRCFYKRII